MHLNRLAKTESGFGTLYLCNTTNVVGYLRIPYCNSPSQKEMSELKIDQPIRSGQQPYLRILIRKQLPISNLAWSCCSLDQRCAAAPLDIRASFVSVN